VGIHALGVNPQWAIWEESRLWRIPPEIWRLATGFMITYPGLALLFQTYFLYSNLSQMEVGHPRFSRREDVVWYLIFVSWTILVSSFPPLWHLYASPYSLSSFCACT
jgi:Derlin-2/3